MKASELILNPDGSVYHLHLRPEEVAPTIITVGDPKRVAEVTKYFDKIEIKKAYREFVTHTGTLNGKRLTVISTGIGTDNIDIVLNEIDALFNIDFASRQIKQTIIPLTFIRIGTSGILRKEIPIDQFLISEHAVGLDGLMYFYKDKSHNDPALHQALVPFFDQLNFYTASASPSLIEQFSTPSFQKGISLTCSGFYGPQMRALRLSPRLQDFFNKIHSFQYKNLHLTNMEMETAGIYALAQLLGHRAISLNALLANRQTGEFSQNPSLAIERLIQIVLKIISNE